jgi:hypothetical protein
MVSGEMESVVAGQIDRAQVRLAELVAALSLGIDLGFGQPTEHVLRQCLIALRLAEGIGLDEEQRAIVYAKIDASTRAGAGLFAMQHGLLPEEEFSAAGLNITNSVPASCSAGTWPGGV